jgi:hypothetical protein
MSFNKVEEEFGGDLKHVTTINQTLANRHVINLNPSLAAIVVNISERRNNSDAGFANEQLGD